MEWAIACICFPVFIGFCVLLGMLKDSVARAANEQRATIQHYENLREAK